MDTKVQIRKQTAKHSMHFLSPLLSNRSSSAGAGGNVVRRESVCKHLSSFGFHVDATGVFFPREEKYFPSRGKSVNVRTSAMQEPGRVKESVKGSIGRASGIYRSRPRRFMSRCRRPTHRDRDADA